MVEVVGEDKSVSKQITCRSCGSILKYFPYEVQTVNSGNDISGSPSGYQHINCPQCTQKVIVKSW